MASFNGLKEPYLRVITPLTTNGNIPLLKNGQQQFEETFLPLSARKHIERRNARIAKTLPHLIAKIETVGI